jgi:adenylylsulfate kinase-like enzyme
MIFWITGQSGAGKTTLSNWMKKELDTHAVTIDGDELRDVFSNKDYSVEGRKKNVELAQNIAKFLNSKYNSVIVSVIAPFREQREQFKKVMGNDIVEIFVKCDEIRSPYTTAYEEPQQDFILINTNNTNDYEKVRTLYREMANMA